jgi:hypothetical protein
MSRIWSRLVVICSAVTHALAVGTALGFGSATVGGGNAPPATPSSPAQLLGWLSDGTPRVIVLDKTYDFTNYCKNGAAFSLHRVHLGMNRWYSQRQDLQTVDLLAKPANCYRCQWLVREL